MRRYEWPGAEGLRINQALDRLWSAFYKAEGLRMMAADQEVLEIVGRLEQAKLAAEAKKGFEQVRDEAPSQWKQWPWAATEFRSVHAIALSRLREMRDYAHFYYIP